MRSMHVMAVSLFMASACGLDSARETYAQKWCSLATRCNNIGSGRLFASNEECLVHLRSSALSLWPTDRCEKRLDSQALQRCFSTVDDATCSAVDQGVIVLRCAPSEVCP